MPAWPPAPAATAISPWAPFSTAFLANVLLMNLFTGVHGNYLKGSIRNAGLDPEALAASDPSKMDFGGGAAKRVWKDIWGSGQGIGAIKQVLPARELVDRLAREYAAARQRLALH